MWTRRGKLTIQFSYGNYAYDTLRDLVAAVMQHRLEQKSASHQKAWFEMYICHLQHRGLRMESFQRRTRENILIKGCTWSIPPHIHATMHFSAPIKFRQTFSKINTCCSLLSYQKGLNYRKCTSLSGDDTPPLWYYVETRSEQPNLEKKEAWPCRAKGCSSSRIVTIETIE